LGPFKKYIESASYNKSAFFRYSGFFNWTMSYRRDSDIHAPYGWAALTGKIYFVKENLEIRI
jgi:hypothetical protein